MMDARGEYDNYDKTVRELEGLPEALLAVKRAIEPQAQSLARHLANHSHHIITSAGNAWPQAFYYGMCILEEMQWIKTRPVHASDFFHGTLELVDKNQSVVLLKGEDECRPLADRLENFAKQHTDKLLVLDTQSFDMTGISPALRKLLSPAVLATMLERISAHLEVITQHPLTTRRYYRRVAY
jgi:fructoselysine-6-phosphate deglycase